MADGGTGAIGGSETERIGSPSELQWLAYIKAFAYPATNAHEDDHECLISGRKRSVSFRCEIIRHRLLPIQLELLQASRTSCVAPLPNLLSLCRRAQLSQCGLGREVSVEAPRAVAGRDPVKAQSFFPALLQSIEFGGIEIGLTNLSGFRRPDHRLPSMCWRVCPCRATFESLAPATLSYRACQSRPATHLKSLLTHDIDGLLQFNRVGREVSSAAINKLPNDRSGLFVSAI
ncbi:hypothetical protein LB535_10135 [Mesorhizobium sp. CA10]|uniref:hypothetical protein n=1 Tax=Mesorhizobium sp. CA10 TaxID=588495 RepID=UPI001CCE1658|nr:hypothetical protein [Mesorhizobium sp. CA10]MBZ9882711.1 hypothetical protein [Mesorhizobium sp. CA10]